MSRTALTRNLSIAFELASFAFVTDRSMRRGSFQATATLLDSSMGTYEATVVYLALFAAR